MKLLFDQNLSPRLLKQLADVYAYTDHVYRLGLDRASDEVIWEYARAQGYMIVTRDADFSELSAIRGFPPKIVWIRRGNCATKDIEAILRHHFKSIEELDRDVNSSVLVLV